MNYSLISTCTSRILLENSANVNAQDNDGYTALHEAASQGKTEIVKLLIEKGADVNAKNKYGKTPLAEALRHEPDNREVIETLLKAGANNPKITELDIINAISNGDHKLAQLLEFVKKKMQEKLR